MAELGNFTINITCPDEGQIKSLGDTIGKMVEEKYKQMVEGDKVLELNTPPSDEMLEKFKTIISEYKLGKSVCCGMGVGIQQPFKVPDGQVFIGGAKVENKEEPKHKPFIVVDGETYISNTHITDLGVSFQGGMSVKGSVVLKSANYVKGVAGWSLDNGTGAFELNGYYWNLLHGKAPYSVKVEEGTLKVFDENGTVRVQVSNFKEKQ